MKRHFTQDHHSLTACDVPFTSVRKVTQIPERVTCRTCKLSATRLSQTDEIDILSRNIERNLETLDLEYGDMVRFFCANRRKKGKKPALQELAPEFV